MIGSPTLPETNVYAQRISVFPSECRQKSCTYKAKLSLTLRWLVDGEVAGSITRTAGQIPIMVKVWMDGWMGGWLGGRKAS